MRAATVTEYGGTPTVTEIPTPEAGPGQILIKLRAAGMNPCLLYTSPSPRDRQKSRMPSSA